MKLNNFLVTCFVAASFAFVGNAAADIVFTVIETGGNVQSTVSGSFDLNATQSYGGIATNPDPFFEPNRGTMAVGNAQSDYYVVDVPWTPYGIGTGDTWDATVGDRVALFSNSAIGFPLGYISGDVVSGTATEFGATFASLGMTEGIYVNTLINGNFSDTVTVRVGIPEPSSAALLGVCLIGAWMRRRR